MADSLFSRKYRLRRRNLPRVRPQDAPYGYVDEVGWLSADTLWIDGWLTLEPVDEIDVRLELGCGVVERTATCLQGPPFLQTGGLSARRWIVLLSLGRDHATASRARRITLDTEIGNLLWLGGVDRLVAPDVIGHFVRGALSRELAEKLDSYLTRGRKIEDLELDDPVLHRNLEALRRHLAPPRNPVNPETARASGVFKVRRIDDLGNSRLDPPVTLILPLLVPPDLLEHHFPQLERSRGTEHWEILLVVSPACDNLELTKRIKGLVDLYGVAVKVVRVRGETNWAKSVSVGAELASGEHLVFLHGQTLTFDAEGLAALVEPLADARTAVDITTPVVQTFDGTVRSAGVRVDLQREPGQPPAIRPVPVNRTPAEVGAGLVDGCGIDCFAIRRNLFFDLHGVAGVFERPDYEVIDLCLRAAAKGHKVLRVPVTFTRFVESSSPPSLPVDVPSDEGDAFVLGRRRRLYTPAETTGPYAASADRPLVTVVVPTLNPGRELVELLDRLQAQEDAPSFEVFVIDSSSRDGTVSLLRERGVRHVVIPRKEFNHGLTRNLGVREARGEVVAFLSQDAMPEPYWLARLLAAFREPGMAGAYSRQIPRPKASPFVRHQLADWPAADPEPRHQEIPRLDLFTELPLEERLARICFDNVSSAVLRSVALDIPFRDLSFGEDRDWAYRVLTTGYAIEYRPDSRVIHSHERSFFYQLRRTFMDHRLIRDLLTAGAPPTLADFRAALRNETARLLHQASREPSVRRRLRARLAAPLRATAGIAGSHLAARSVHGVASGSRTWSWISRRLARGV